MEWTAATSILVALVLLPLATAVVLMALLLIGRVVLRSRVAEGLRVYGEGWAAACGRCCGLQ
jgi:hypothetical protein